MKLISLNTWGGRGGIDSLLNFFQRRKDVDVFCLQEMWNGGEEMVGVIAGGVPLHGVTTSLLTDIGSVLTAHSVHFHPNFKDYYGLATYVSMSFPAVAQGEEFVYKERGWVSKEDPGNHGRNIQYVMFETPAGVRTVINFHGMWNGKGKGDNEERLLQSAHILKFTETLTNPFVLIGDFNLSPDTESIQKFEEAGLRNLIREYGISDTRGPLYGGPNRYADYCFVSDGIEVSDFRVLNEPVSDHLPLYLEWK